MNLHGSIIECICLVGRQSNLTICVVGRLPNANHWSRQLLQVVIRKALFCWCVVLWLLSATVWGCNCPHELFFPVMSDDSPLVRGDPVPRGPNRRGTGPLVSPLTWQRWRKTFRSSAAPRHAAVSATSRHAGRRVREPSQARSRIPATSPLGLQ